MVLLVVPISRKSMPHRLSHPQQQQQHNLHVRQVYHVKSPVCHHAVNVNVPLWLSSLPVDPCVCIRASQTSHHRMAYLHPWSIHSSGLMCVDRRDRYPNLPRVTCDCTSMWHLYCTIVRLCRFYAIKKGCLLLSPSLFCSLPLYHVVLLFVPLCLPHKPLD